MSNYKNNDQLPSYGSISNENHYYPQLSNQQQPSQVYSQAYQQPVYQPIQPQNNNQTTQPGETLQPSQFQTGTNTKLCKYCQYPYELPNGATSWRCKNKSCNKFNDLNPECIIL